MSENFKMRLIELVRANPDLHERELRSTPYDTNKKRKMEIWRSIADSLQRDVNTCISTWNHLLTKLRRETEKEKAGGAKSNWSLLSHMRFLQQPHHAGSHRNLVDTNRRSPKPQSTIEEVHNEEEDLLQEAMDEQLAISGAAAPALPLSPPATNHATAAPPPPLTAAPVSAELLKRIETLLEGLGEANRVKAEKRILAFLCKCNLRALNDEQIDDLVI